MKDFFEALGRINCISTSIIVDSALFFSFMINGQHTIFQFSTFANQCNYLNYVFPHTGLLFWCHGYSPVYYSNITDSFYMSGSGNYSLTKLLMLHFKFPRSVYWVVQQWKLKLSRALCWSMCFINGFLNNHSLFNPFKSFIVKSTPSLLKTHKPPSHSLTTLDCLILISLVICQKLIWHITCHDLHQQGHQWRNK